MLFKFYQFSRNASWQKNNQPRGLIGKFMRALPKIQSGLIMRMELKLGQKCILYNTFFSMSEGSRNSSQRRLSEQSDDQSQESFQFQELKTGENQSISKAFDLVEDSNLSKSSEYKNQQRIKIYEAQLQDKINMLEKQLKVRQQQLEKQTKSKNQYYRLYQKLLQQSSQLTEKNQISIMENGQLKDINLQLKKLCKQLQEENQGYAQKVNFLLKKIQLQKEDIDSKFNVIRRNLQALTKVPLKNVENQNMVKLVASKFVQMEKILNKLTEMDQMIIQKAPKSKTAPENTDILQEKFNIAQKIQNLLVKQQSKINALKQYNLSLEQQLNEAKKNSNSISTGLGKIFNPVMKFCKAEEQKQSEIKKKKENI